MNTISTTKSNYFLAVFLATGLLAVAFLAAAFLAAGLFATFFALGLFAPFLAAAAGLFNDFLETGLAAAGLLTAFFSADFFTLFFLVGSSSSPLAAFFLHLLRCRLLGRLFTCISTLGWRFLGNFFLGFSSSAAILGFFFLAFS